MKCGILKYLIPSSEAVRPRQGEGHEIPIPCQLDGLAGQRQTTIPDASSDITKAISKVCEGNFLSLPDLVFPFASRLWEPKHVVKDVFVGNNASVAPLRRASLARRLPLHLLLNFSDEGIGGPLRCLRHPFWGPSRRSVGGRGCWTLLELEVGFL